MQRRPSTAGATSPPPVQIIGILSLGLIAISSGAILVRFSQEAPSLTIAFYRLAWGSLLLAPWYLKEREKTFLSADRRIYAVSGIALALHFAFWISSLRYTSVAVSVLLVNMSPLLVAIFAYFHLGERLRRRGALGLLMSISGATFLIISDLRTLGDWRGAVLALLGALSYAVYVIAGRRLRPRRGLISYAFPVYVLAGLFLLTYCLLQRIPITGFDYRTHLFLLLLGLLPQGIGHTSLNWSLRYLPATLVSSLTLTEPVLAAVLAWWFLAEGITIWVLTGGLLVCGGIWLLSKGGIAESEESSERGSGEERFQEIAVVIPCHQGRVWSRMRQETGHLDGFQEFPGGKIEEGERPREAARRELFEETGLSVPPERLHPFEPFVHSYQDRRLRLHFFLLRLEDSRLLPEKGWKELSDLRPEDFPPANRELLSSLTKSLES